MTVRDAPAPDLAHVRTRLVAAKFVVADVLLDERGRAVAFVDHPPTVETCKKWCMSVGLMLVQLGHECDEWGGTRPYLVVTEVAA
jgi:hypothetical protein